MIIIIHTYIYLYVFIYIFIYKEVPNQSKNIYILYDIFILIQTYNYNTVYVTGKTWVKRLKS